jgi:peroxiredoxin Q/BCP
MISVDSLEDNTNFAKKENANFPILADPTKTTAKAWGVLGRAELANRWTFFVGPDGKIVDIETMVTPSTAGQDVVARLQKLGVPTR